MHYNYFNFTFGFSSLTANIVQLAYKMYINKLLWLLGINTTATLFVIKPRKFQRILRDPSPTLFSPNPITQDMANK